LKTLTTNARTVGAPSKTRNNPDLLWSVFRAPGSNHLDYAQDNDDDDTGKDGALANERGTKWQVKNTPNGTGRGNPCSRSLPRSKLPDSSGTTTNLNKQNTHTEDILFLYFQFILRPRNGPRNPGTIMTGTSFKKKRELRNMVQDDN